MVASIIMYSLSLMLANRLKIRSKTPLFAIDQSFDEPFSGVRNDPANHARDTPS
jgi:hypothetical protein